MRLARHCAACGNNSENAKHVATGRLQLQAVLAAQQQQPALASSRVQEEQELARLCKVSVIMHM